MEGLVPGRPEFGRHGLRAHLDARAEDSSTTALLAAKVATRDCTAKLCRSPLRPGGMCR
jgi:hypothetical protein